MSDIPPPSLKGKIVAYLNQAKERTTAGDNTIAYYCKVHALSEAMAVRANIPKADMGYVIGLMDQVEAEKKGLSDLDDAQVLIENRAFELFDRADNADRANPTVPRLQTAKDFYASATLLEVCKEFGELPEDLAEKIKYGKWRYVEICKAAKEKRAPAPPRGVDAEDSSGAAGAEGSSSAAAAEPVPPAAPSPGYVAESSPYMPPTSDATSYLDLPPAAPPVPTAPTVPAAPPYVASSTPNSFDSPPAPPTHYPAPPAAPAAPVAPPAAYAPTAYAPPPTNYLTDDRNTIVEAARLSQQAVSSLQFQRVETAVHALQKALSLLTTPPAPSSQGAPP